MAIKEELLHEIDIVTTFSSKYNMKDSLKTARYIKFFDEKKIFKTQIGIQYIERLNQIKDGKTEETCFICKKNPSYDGVLCDDCMSKFTRGKKDFFGRDNFAKLDTVIAGEKKKEAQRKSSIGTEQIISVADAAKTKMSEISNKVQSRIHEDDVQKAKVEISEKMNAAGEKAKQFAKENDLEGKAKNARKKAQGFDGKFVNWWKARKKWQKITIIVVVAVIFLGVFLENSNGRFQDDADKYISSVQDEFVGYMRELGAKSDIPVEIMLYSGQESGSDGKYIYKLYFDGQDNATIGVNYENGKKESIIISSGMGVDSFLTTAISAIKASDSSLSSVDALEIAYKSQEVFDQYMQNNAGDTEYTKGKRRYMYYVEDGIHILLIIY